MAGYQRCSSLALLCLLLCHNSMAATPFRSTACAEKSRSTGSFENFKWGHFLEHNDPTWHLLSENSIKSFLNFNELDKVKDVCKNKGGQLFQPTGSKRKSTNLCISREKFNFVTVISNPWRIRAEFKHLIVACDLVDGECLPTHFEANKENFIPNINTIGCRGGPKPKIYV